MTYNIAHTVLKKLRLSRDIQNANPDFDSDCETLCMTVTELVKYMKRYEIDYFYSRKDILKNHKRNDNVVSKRQRVSSAGSDVYVCSLGRKTKDRSGIVLRNKPSQGCGCSARFTVRFPPGYEHTPDAKKINVGEHGDKIVTITWNWKHNHNVNDQKAFDSSKLSREAKTLLKIAVIDYGVTWNQILHEQKQLLEKCDGQCPYEIMKIKSRHVRYYQRELPQNNPFPFKHNQIVVSFGILIESIMSSGGFAEYTTDFRSTDASQELDKFESSQKRPVWSLIIVSAWQKDVLVKNANIIHLDSAHKTCYGLQTDEKVYLFTICVKNQVTGSGAPGAFMLSNSGKAPVIADFLRKVESYTNFAPKQAVIDCATAEINALKAVWGSEFPIMYCRFHVEKAFREGVHNKIEPSADKEQIEIEVREDFDEVRQSKTKTEADQKISWFLEKYKAHTAFIPYMREWLCWKKYIIEGYNPNYVRGEDTDNLTESFHALLKSPKFLGKRCDRRPDVLAHQLFTFVVPSFKGEEKKVLFGFSNRICNEAETLAESKAAEVPEEDVQKKAFLFGEGEITVRSFTDHTKEYSVNLELAGSEKNTCTCPVNFHSGSMCEHIYLAERFWEANTCPEETSFETWNSERSSFLENRSLDSIREIGRTNDLSVIELDSSSNEEDESFSDSFTPRADHEDSHTSISLEAQNAIFMANSTANIEEPESSSQDLLYASQDFSDTGFSEDETSQENDDLMNSSTFIVNQCSINRPQQEFDGNLQAATQRKELEKQSTILKLDQALLKTLKMIAKQRYQLTSVEQLYKYTQSVSRMGKIIIRDSKNPNAKQRG